MAPNKLDFNENYPVNPSFVTGGGVQSRMQPYPRRGTGVPKNLFGAPEPGEVNQMYKEEERKNLAKLDNRYKVIGIEGSHPLKCLEANKDRTSHPIAQKSCPRTGLTPAISASALLETHSKCAEMRSPPLQSQSQSQSQWQWKKQPSRAEPNPQKQKQKQKQGRMEKGKKWQATSRDPTSGVDTPTDASKVVAANKKSVDCSVAAQRQITEYLPIRKSACNPRTQGIVADNDKNVANMSSAQQRSQCQTELKK